MINRMLPTPMMTMRAGTVSHRTNPHNVDDAMHQYAPNSTTCIKSHRNPPLSKKTNTPATPNPNQMLHRSKFE